LKQGSFQIWNAGKPVQREIVRMSPDISVVNKGGYRHFMLKEIFEQPEVLRNTLAGRLSKTQLLEQAFGVAARAIFDRTKSVQIVACGTSSHAGLIAKFWFENIARIPCTVDIASEYRYRNVLVPDDCRFISISQSGETADTLAALRYVKAADYVGCLAVCIASSNSLVRRGFERS